MDPAQRAALLGVKLRALTIGNFGVATDTLTQIPFQAGAAMYQQETATLYLLVDVPQIDRDPMDLVEVLPRPPRGWLGGSLVMAARHGCTRVHIMSDHFDGGDARRADHATTVVSLWTIQGRNLHAVEVEAFTPAPVPPPPLMALQQQIRDGGAEPVIDHGVLRAEVLGLEVARWMIDPETGEAWLEVGVGRHDRLAQAMMHQGQDPAVALANAVQSIRDHRRFGAMSHPANQLALSRWLRVVVTERPELAGLPAGTWMQPVPGVEAPELKRLGPALLFADSSPSGPMLVACSVGVDLDAAVDAADMAAFLDARAVLLCVPVGDDLPALRLVAAALDVPVQIVTVPADWAA